MNTKRISYIDMAKGIGIILVVYGHLGFASESVLTWITSFHMPLFFILSGMLLSHTNAVKYSMADFISKKAKALLIPYFAFSILSILFSAILDFGTFASYLPDALLQTFSFYGISVLWFLPALFFGETIFLWLRKHTSFVLTGIFSIVICLLTVFSVTIYHYYYVIDFSNSFSILGAYLISVLVRTGIAVTFLAIGYYIQHFFFQKERPIWIYAGLTLLFLILNILLAQKNGLVDLHYLLFNDYFLYFGAAFTGSMAVICLSAFLPASKALLYIGKNSLIIMATHMNCRFLGICYAVGSLLYSHLPVIGTLGYQAIVIFCMIGLELGAIYGINRYAPFLLGKKNSYY